MGGLEGKVREKRKMRRARERGKEEKGKRERGKGIWKRIKYPESEH